MGRSIGGRNAMTECRRRVFAVVFVGLLLRISEARMRPMHLGNNTGYLTTIASTTTPPATFTVTESPADANCPCVCPHPHSLTCSNSRFPRLPDSWPITFRAISIRNSSLRILERDNLLRFAPHLEIFRVENTSLAAIERFAFRGLNALRLLLISHNEHLVSLDKTAMAEMGVGGVPNGSTLKIRLISNGLREIRGLAFRDIVAVRELTIEGRGDLHIQTLGLSAITQADFIHLSRIERLAPLAFANSSRIHRLTIRHSKLRSGLEANVFANLSHVNELLIENCDVESVDEDAFAGLDTVGRLTIRANRISRFTGHAFSRAVNVGTIAIERNVIELLETEALISSAARLHFIDNTLHCECGRLAWILHSANHSLLISNYCGPEANYRTLADFAAFCPQLHELPSAVSRTISSRIADHSSLRFHFQTFLFLLAWCGYV